MSNLNENVKKMQKNIKESMKNQIDLKKWCAASQICIQTFIFIFFCDSNLRINAFTRIIGRKRPDAYTATLYTMHNAKSTTSFLPHIFSKKKIQKKIWKKKIGWKSSKWAN